MMPIQALTAAEAHLLADFAGAYGATGDLRNYAALIWCVRNSVQREMRGGVRRRIDGPYLETIAFLAAPKKGPAPKGVDSPDYSRAMAQCLLVWTGDVPDPTHGAVMFADHDLAAGVDCMTATALIGPYLFLRWR